jgi:hypothetical protein
LATKRGRRTGRPTDRVSRRERCFPVESETLGDPCGAFGLCVLPVSVCRASPYLGKLGRSRPISALFFVLGEPDATRQSGLIAQASQASKVQRNQL